MRRFIALGCRGAHTIDKLRRGGRLPSQVYPPVRSRNIGRGIRGACRAPKFAPAGSRQARLSEIPWRFNLCSRIVRDVAYPTTPPPTPPLVSLIGGDFPHAVGSKCVRGPGPARWTRRCVSLKNLCALPAAPTHLCGRFGKRSEAYPFNRPPFGRANARQVDPHVRAAWSRRLRRGLFRPPSHIPTMDDRAPSIAHA